MILRIKGFDLEIEVNEGNTPILLIKNKMILKRILEYLTDQINGGDNNELVLDDNGKMIQMQKQVLMIIDYFSLDQFDKLIESAAYKMIVNLINEELEQKIKIETELLQLTNSLYISTLDLDISMENMLESAESIGN